MGKAGGATRLGRESRSQRLGIKAYAGEKVKPGMIIIRQRGSKFVPGKNTEIGKDDTIYSLKEGRVNFTTKTKKAFNNDVKKVNVVNVE